MSQWTHVNAVIRFDGIKGVTLDPDLGRTVGFDDPDPEHKWGECNVPRGSEGSLEYTLTEVGGGMPRFTAAIWGDLRDYSDTAEVEAYLNHIVFGHAIRSGIAEIRVGCQLTRVLRYDSASKLWQSIWEQAAEEEP